MGCGASKSANARNDSNIDEVEAVTTSVTQIRDMAPAEVADTGAHPPRRDDPIRRNVYYQAATTLSLPGVVPESNFGDGRWRILLPFLYNFSSEGAEKNADANRLSSHSRRGESLIKMHPPKKPQRLEDSDILKIKPIEPDVEITNADD
ncbi:uncharacterized protein LOC129983575 isoform X2 [Argiope bruennichi]|uniref:Uncharacterized protein n=1 Tax=Argiope bruennichi TaxID=94029 RepID=A0A8T0EJB7_ARGBR|nr:uncharacterized protein LOC129983575 isoform X2 [Argiope bruennichi]KAF8774103.1 hypothetical protein HNY73_016693 [Argiope bruennichi]